MALHVLLVHLSQHKQVDPQKMTFENSQFNFSLPDSMTDFFNEAPLFNITHIITLLLKTDCHPTGERLLSYSYGGRNVLTLAQPKDELSSFFSPSRYPGVKHSRYFPREHIALHTE